MDLDMEDLDSIVTFSHRCDSEIVVLLAMLHPFPITEFYVWLVVVIVVCWLIGS